MADIIIILDESGSMQIQRKTMVNNINEMISEQKRLLVNTELAPERVNVHIYRFSTSVKKPISSNLTSFPTFTENDYEPDGGTALCDAIGHVMKIFNNTTNKTVLVIATDGQENSSHEYDMPGIKSKLDEKKKAGWTVIYLSENLETMKQGESFGVRGTSNVAVHSLCCAMKNTHFNSALSKAVQCDEEGYEKEMACFSSTSKTK